MRLLLIIFMMLSIAACKDEVVHEVVEKEKEIITVSKTETIPPSQDTIDTNAKTEPEKPTYKIIRKAPITEIKDPLEQFETQTASGITEVQFKTLTDFDLPLEDQKMADKQDLKELRESMPDGVKKLHNTKIRIKGFMVPVELNEKNLVSAFLFAPDQTSCCYGRVPDLNGFIYCTSEKGLPNLKDINIELTGHFKSMPEYNVFDEAVYLYQMKAESYKELSLKLPVNAPQFDF